MAEETSDRTKRLFELQKARQRELQRARSVSFLLITSLTVLAGAAAIFTVDRVSAYSIIRLFEYPSAVFPQIFAIISILFVITTIVLFGASRSSDRDHISSIARTSRLAAEVLLRTAGATTLKAGTTAAERAIQIAREAAEAKDREAQDFMRRPTDYIDVLTQFRFRMRGEERRLKINSVVNLIWGILFSLLSGLWLLLSVNELKGHGTYASISDIVAAYSPRAALAIILQLVSFFFLRLYASTEHEIKHHKNEITNMESRFAGALFAAEASTPATRVIVLKSFMAVERNFLIKKGERTAATEVDTRYNDLVALVETLVQTKARQQKPKSKNSARQPN